MKTKKNNPKKLLVMTDSPSVKTTNGVFLLPELEVHVWPSNNEILTEWEANHPEIPGIKGDLWGFWEGYPDKGSAKRGGPIRIHTRSVRSHRSKEEFYHTIGHELAHILESMERAEPSTMHKARWRRLFYEFKCTFYQTKAFFFSHLKRFMGRGDTETCKEHK